MFSSSVSYIIGHIIVWGRGEIKVRPKGEKKKKKGNEKKNHAWKYILDNSATVQKHTKYKVLPGVSVQIIG